MQKDLRWYEHVTINLYWFGANLLSGTITPLLLPYLVALFVPASTKNTYFSYIRVASLAVAMLVQPSAGLLSDRCTHRLGRRRPYIIYGTLASVLALAVLASSTFFAESAPPDARSSGVSAAYPVLLMGMVFLQASLNTSSGGALGLIPDLVPGHQRGLASGVKALMELLPAFVIAGLMMAIGPILEQDWAALLKEWWASLTARSFLAVGFLMAALVGTMVVTAATVREERLRAAPTDDVRGPLLRLVGLTAIFVLTTQIATRLVGASAGYLQQRVVTLELQVAAVGLSGLTAMAGSVFVGVYLGAWVGIGRDAPRQRSFIWWVVNRLLFLAGVGSIQSFLLYFLSDVLRVPDPAEVAARLLAITGVFLVLAIVGGGWLADRIGRKPMVAASALLAALGTALMLASKEIGVVLTGVSIIGIGAGTFMSTSWALGTDLAPPKEAARYLGISNLAGAGAGIVGAGIGGPMADSINALQPGLGYVVVFATYGGLFVLSAVVLAWIRMPARGSSH